MSSTRSPLHVAPATKPTRSEMLIVSHGSPSDPEPQEAFVRDLAEAVGALTGWTVKGATLAKKGALEAAVDGMTAPLVFPHFMADGWFVSTNLPKRLQTAGLSDWSTTMPLGMLDQLPALALRRLKKTVLAENLSQKETTLVVAAHGSPSDSRPARATEDFADALRRLSMFRAVRVGYVDEEPSLEAAATVIGPAIVLPFFAAKAGHVLMDLPEALEAVNFEGTVLPPIGTWAHIPALIAGALYPQAKARVA